MAGEERGVYGDCEIASSFVLRIVLGIVVLDVRTWIGVGVEAGAAEIGIRRRPAVFPQQPSSELGLG